MTIKEGVITEFEELASATDAEAAKVFHIQIDHAKIPEFSDSLLGRFKNATFVGFSHCQIQSIHPDAFKELSKLETVFLEGNDIRDIVKDLFKYNQNLSHVSLQQNFLENLPEGLFDHNPNMEILQLDGNHFSTLEQLITPKHVNIISLSHQRTGELVVRVIKGKPVVSYSTIVEWEIEKLRVRKATAKK